MKPIWIGARKDEARSTKRQRERSGERNSVLKGIEEKLLFILFYFKIYPLQEVQGYLFGMGQSQAGDWMHRLTPILNRAFGYEKQLPVRKAHDVDDVPGFGVYH